MENLAQQLKKELTERAKQSESCKKYLLDYVMQCFRDGEYPVEIYCKKWACDVTNKEWLKRVGVDPEKVHRATIDFKYENGKHYGRTMYSPTGVWYDITDSKMAQLYAVDGNDESDKKLFLESEGFHVFKTWIYGKGDLLQITY